MIYLEQTFSEKAGSMTVLLDQLKSGLDILSRIDTSFFISQDEDDDLYSQSDEEHPEGTLHQAPTLKSLLQEMGTLPPYSIVIGACPDRAHLFLDLTDPQPGSILLVGESGSGKTHFLHAILTSAIELNSPRRLRFLLIGDDLPEMLDLSNSPHCYQHQWPNSRKAGDLIYEMADLVETRQNEKQEWSAIIIAIDDLARFTRYLDEDAIQQLAWLVQCGPAVRVWTVAAIPAEELADIDQELSSGFETRLLGKIESAKTMELIDASAKEHTRELEAGSQFGVVFDGEWIPFWIPKVPLRKASHLKK